MKRKIIVIAVAVLCLAIISSGTIAYFTYEDTAKNVITTGNIKIKLEEWTLKSGKRVPFENTEAMPGVEISKIVDVKNVGDNPAFIRVKVDAEDLPVSFDINKADWTYSDGYYYYNSVLPANETTTPLFTTVHFDENMGNEWMNKKIEIAVTASATQSDNNGSDALHASGWSDIND